MSLAIRLTGAAGGLLGGLGVVVASAAAVDSAFPPTARFSPTTSRFDQSSFGGRFASMLTVMDPSTLLASDEDVRSANKLLSDFQAGNAKATDAELWAARKLRDSAMHPDTKEIIPGPFRVRCCFAFGFDNAHSLI